MGSFQVKIGRAKLNFGGVKDVLNDDAVVGDCVGRMAAVCAAANDATAELYPDSGFGNDPFTSSEYTTYKGNRAAYVVSSNPLGRAAQARHSALTSAMDAGR